MNYLITGILALTVGILLGGAINHHIENNQWERMAVANGCGAFEPKEAAFHWQSEDLSKLIVKK